MRRCYDYSQRSATIGSTREAFLAGIDNTQSRLEGLQAIRCVAGKTYWGLVSLMFR